MWAMTISLKRPITRLKKTDAIMISEAMPTFLDKDLLMDVEYQKVTEKAKDYEFGYCLEFGYWDLGFLVYSAGGEWLQS
jgi:hypothetical protein